MVDRIEELNLPNAIVFRLIKEALPPGTNVSKEARTAITKAASVFILYVTSAANSIRIKNGHKIIQAQYIFDALEEVEFEHFLPQLKESLDAFKQSVKDKKERKKDESINAALNAEEMENDTEIENSTLNLDESDKLGESNEVV